MRDGLNASPLETRKHTANFVTMIGLHGYRGSKFGKENCRMEEPTEKI